MSLLPSRDLSALLPLVISGALIAAFVADPFVSIKMTSRERSSLLLLSTAEVMSAADTLSVYLSTFPSQQRL